ncbi:DMT family transporter [Pseudomonadota bacterium]
MLKQKILIGILFMVIAVTFNGIKDGLAKILVLNYSPIFLIWSQLAVTYLVLLPVIVYQHGPRIIVPLHFWLQILRGVCLALGVGCFYTAVQYIPLADGTAVVFTTPLVVALLSPLLLGEKVNLRHWVTVVVGFVGVLLILRPDLEGSRLGYFIALGSGISLGFFFILTRKLASTTSTWVAAAYTPMAGAILLLPAIPFVWIAPEIKDFWLFFGFYVLSTAGQFFMVTSFRFGPAAVIAPFHFTQIITTTIFGLIVFSEFPESLTWVGIAIVISASIYLGIKEKDSEHKD